MLDSIKKRVLKARNEGSLMNRLLHFTRVYGLKLKGEYEVRRANQYFKKNKLVTNKLAPDFLCAGMQKAATSWLDKMLRNHKNVFLPFRKEVHYWDHFQFRGLEWYLYHFKDAEPDQLRGEVTPGYSILSKSEIKKIYNLNPDTKIIFFLRNPIERAWSQIYMDLVRDKIKKRKDVSTEEIISYLHSSTVSNRGNYKEILTNWSMIFPSEQIHIDYFDHVSQSPQQLLCRICNFLDIDAPRHFKNYNLKKKVNKNPRKELPQIVSDILVKKYSKEIENLYIYLNKPPEINEWIKDMK